MKLVLSSLPHTWILDLDGTLVKHNVYKIDGNDIMLHGAKEFFCSIPEEDKIIILTSRTEAFKDQTESFLKENQIRFDYIIYNIPYGERILINDSKPSGLKMAFALTPVRNQFEDINIEIDKDR